jgi:integrase
MTQPKVTLYWNCKTPNGWKRFPAAIGRNGKIRPRFAQVKKAQVLYEDGHYECRFNQDGKYVWKNVGADAAIAQAEQIHLGRVLTARVAACEAGTEIVETPGRVQLRNKAKEYKERQIARGKKRAAVTFGTAIEEFLPSVKVQFADELTETVINRWYTALRAKKNSDRTIYNKHVSVFGFLKWCKLDTKHLAEKAPTFTEKAVEVYKTEDMKKFFASLADPYHRIVFEVLLKTGLRMQEAMFLQWHQFDFNAGTLTVRERNEDGFEIKDRAERTLPIPATLVRHLKVWKEEHGGKLVLGTSNDTPNWKWLPLLKRLVRGAELNCGHCVGCKEQEECERWYLHKFRATYTTNLLRAGIDPRTVMQYTGHSDLATVMRYLSPAELPDTQKKVNSINWGD